MSKRLMLVIAVAIAASPVLAADDFIPTVNLEEGAIGVEDVVSWTRKSKPYEKLEDVIEADEAAMFFIAASPDSQAVSEMLSWRWRVQSRFKPRRA